MRNYDLLLVKQLAGAMGGGRPSSRVAPGVGSWFLLCYFSPFVHL